MIKLIAITILALPLNAFTFEFGTEQEIEQAKHFTQRIYLATYPRSGNHWVRFLIEEATGITTSSVYRDPDPQHLPEVFPWGGYCCEHGYEGTSRYPEEDEIVVIKTHFPVSNISGFDELPYKTAIRIVRNPVDSIYSFYVWVQNYQQEPIEPIIPKEFLNSAIDSWYRFQNYWNEADNVITLRYEDMYMDPVPHLKTILTAIGYDFTDADIERALAKYPPAGGLYKHSHHYNEEDLILLKEKLQPLLEYFGY